MYNLPDIPKVLDSFISQLDLSAKVKNELPHLKGEAKREDMILENFNDLGSGVSYIHGDKKPKLRSDIPYYSVYSKGVVNSEVELGDFTISTSIDLSLYIDKKISFEYNTQGEKGRIILELSDGVNIEQYDSNVISSSEWVNIEFDLNSISFTTITSVRVIFTTVLGEFYNTSIRNVRIFDFYYTQTLLKLSCIYTINDTIEVDGMGTYDVISVDYPNNEVIIDGYIGTVDNLVLNPNNYRDNIFRHKTILFEKPIFINGTMRNVNSYIQTIKGQFIFLVSITRERYDNRVDASIGLEAD